MCFLVRRSPLDIPTVRDCRQMSLAIETACNLRDRYSHDKYWARISAAVAILHIPRAVPYKPDPKNSSWLRKNGTSRQQSVVVSVSEVGVELAEEWGQWTRVVVAPK
jgi:hypothetical protein